MWAFRIVDLGGPWCWSALDGEGLAEVLARFRDYESMTWEQIDGPTGSHGVEPWKLTRQAQARLTEIRQDDASELFSLRITGRRRVWGIMDEHMLRVLWCRVSIRRISYHAKDAAWPGASRAFPPGARGRFTKLRIPGA